MKNLILLSLLAGAVAGSPALAQSTNPRSATHTSAPLKSVSPILSTPQAISVSDRDSSDTLMRPGIGV